MIVKDKILAQLHHKRDQFIEFDSSFRDEARIYANALRRLASTSSAELNDQLSGESAPGAFPTLEFDRAPDLCLNFPWSFDNHQEARIWAHDCLLNHTTFAVDGSQIPATRDFNIPVAALQVAWFVNHHTRVGIYIKDCEFEVLSPEELIVEYAGDRQISEQQVNTRRFELEVETLCRLISKIAERWQAQPSAKLPVAFFDSSLVISFAERLQDEMRQRHIDAMLSLLRCAESCGVPLIGYVDSSDARDLTKMLECAFNLPKAERTYDTQLINANLSWGDRTPLFVCARRGADLKRSSVLETLAAEGHQIGFTYIKSTAASLPARLETPMWVYERGLLDQVVDVVRGEIVVGNGYPYAIESADAATVITARDRDAFLLIIQKFLKDQGIEFKGTQKRTSKGRRRS